MLGKVASGMAGSRGILHMGSPHVTPTWVKVAPRSLGIIHPIQLPTYYSLHSSHSLFFLFLKETRHTLALGFCTILRAWKFLPLPLRVWMSHSFTSYKALLKFTFWGCPWPHGLKLDSISPAVSVLPLLTSFHSIAITAFWLTLHGPYLLSLFPLAH